MNIHWKWWREILVDLSTHCFLSKEQKGQSLDYRQKASHQGWIIRLAHQQVNGRILDGLERYQLALDYAALFLHLERQQNDIPDIHFRASMRIEAFLEGYSLFSQKGERQETNDSICYTSCSVTEEGEASQK